MTIHIHIDRLVLDGINLPRHHHPKLQAALETELGRLIAINGLSAEVLAGGLFPTLSVGEMPLNAQHTPAQTGQHIAQAVYRGLGP
jgi:hypothetical protein